MLEASPRDFLEGKQSQSLLGRGGVLMTIRRMAAGLMLALAVSGCQPSLDGRYMREGAGTTLAWEGLGEATRLQENYIGYICQQAGLAGGAGPCVPLDGRDWTIFVQAGLNDIDVRCDAYLAWLDDKRRSTAPILQELSDLRTAATAIMAVTGAGVDAIAIAGAAFGLASNTFTNLRSRLVLEVNHSTVQAVVLSAQNRLRTEILAARIDNRPAALHALRQYLRACMPFTIETEINTTITAFERGDAPALVYRRPLLDATTARSGLIADPRARLAPYRPPAPPPPGPTEARRVGGYEAGLYLPDIKKFQQAACIAPADGLFTPRTRAALLAFLGRQGIKDPSEGDRITILDGSRLLEIAEDGKASC